MNRSAVRFSDLAVSDILEQADWYASQSGPSWQSDGKMPSLPRCCGSPPRQGHASRSGRRILPALGLLPAQPARHLSPAHCARRPRPRKPVFRVNRRVPPFRLSFAGAGAFLPDPEPAASPRFHKGGSTTLQRGENASVLSMALAMAVLDLSPTRPKLSRTDTPHTYQPISRAPGSREYTRRAVDSQPRLSRDAPCIRSPRPPGSDSTPSLR